MKHYASMAAVASIALSCAMFATAARAEPELRFEFIQNISEPQILDVDTVSAWGTNASSLIHFGAARLASAPESCKAKEAKSDLECILLRLAVAWPLYYIIDGALMTTVHEYGHFRAFSRLGMTDFVMFRFADSKEERATPWGVFGLSLRAYAAGKSLGAEYGAGVTQWEKLYRGTYGSHFVEAFLFLDAGGVNQSQYTAERMARDMKKGTAHPLDGIVYAQLSQNTARYGSLPTGDLAQYVWNLRARGLKTSMDKIRREAQLPKLFSGAFFAFAREGFEWVATGDEIVEPLSFRVGQFRFFWPEFASYLTVFGPTRKASKELRWERDGTALSFLLQGEESLSDLIRLESNQTWAYPFPATRAHLREYTAGIGAEYGGFAAGIRLTQNADTDGVWREADVSYRFGSYTAGIAGYYGKGYSFAREIKGQTPYFARNEELGAKLFFELSFPYR